MSYQKLAVQHLAKVSGLPCVPAEDLIEATSDCGAYVMMHSALKRVAVKMSKICNDLRLLSSGPRTGLNEINLPELQAGSSIMQPKLTQSYQKWSIRSASKSSATIPVSPWRQKRVSCS
ncbi:lyase family protein [Pectobacterium brasiliense]|uniref:lyase family protein n=1 Tax=Pectobacterium brasiliense TaxID=180957 RepID=UPI0038733986